MRILFTGSSSFTGFWLVRQLVADGHDVAATFTRRSAQDYGDDVRRLRVDRLQPLVQSVYGCRFGDESFVDVIRQVRPEMLCHHGADVTDYRSPSFDAYQALLNNTSNLRVVLQELTATGCPSILLTGSVFEGGEGAGSDGLPIVSPYGLSKGLTWSVFDYYCRVGGFSLGKFVIPNPFGPLEEPRFTAYLARSWLAGECPTVRTPEYIRDNIHVSLLARAYAQFAGRLAGLKGGAVRVNPSGYIESQGSFAQRFAAEMRQRTGLPCPVRLAEQDCFDEPRIRVNTDPADFRRLGWDESHAWNEIAEYYFGGPFNFTHRSGN